MIFPQPHPSNFPTEYSFLQNVCRLVALSYRKPKSKAKIRKGHCKSMSPEFETQLFVVRNALFPSVFVF